MRLGQAAALHGLQKRAVGILPSGEHTEGGPTPTDYSILASKKAPGIYNHPNSIGHVINEAQPMINRQKAVGPAVDAASDLAGAATHLLPQPLAGATRALGSALGPQAVPHASVLPRTGGAVLQNRYPETISEYGAQMKNRFNPPNANIQQGRVPYKEMPKRTQFMLDNGGLDEYRGRTLGLYDESSGPTFQGRPTNPSPTITVPNPLPSFLR